MIRVDWLITGLNIVGGAEVFTSQFANYLSARDIQLRVITLRSGGDLLNSLIKQGIPVIVIGVNSKRNPLPLLRLYRLWKTSPPLILHTHLYHAGIIGRLIARFAGIPHVIVHQHGAENARSTLRSIIDRATSWMVEQYIVPSEAVKDILNRRERVPGSKIKVIHYGIDTEKYHALVPITGLTFPSGVPVIGCVGRLVKEKSHIVLLQALHLLKQKNVQFHAIMVGDGPERIKLEELSRVYEINELVTWTGYQSNVESWLAQFDIFVLASAWEGLPISILEAMASHLPVVATAVGGTPEAVVTNETGILVPPNDPEKLANALISLLRNPSLRLKMGTAGYTRVKECFSVECVVENIYQLYVDLTG